LFKKKPIIGERRNEQQKIKIYKKILKEFIETENRLEKGKEEQNLVSISTKQGTKTKIGPN